MSLPPPRFTEYIVADLGDAANADLARSSLRISSLLRQKAVLNDPNACACLDDLLGAVQALFLARSCSFEDRVGKQIELPVLQKRAEGLAEGRIRTDGKWIAGFYFNSALFRLSAVYHRLLKVVLDTPNARDHVGDLRDKVAAKYKYWTSADWSSRRISELHKEVNTLKHSAAGIYVTRSIRQNDAAAGLREMLDIFEAWVAHVGRDQVPDQRPNQRLQPTKPRRPPKPRRSKK